MLFPELMQAKSKSIAPEYQLDKRSQWSVTTAHQFRHPQTNTAANDAVESFLGSPYRSLIYPEIKKIFNQEKCKC